MDLKKLIDSIRVRQPSRRSIMRKSPGIGLWRNYVILTEDELDQLINSIGDGKFK